ncbi:MAG: DUF3095 domain-containing protein [Bradymonadaceae bacterium]
MTTDFSDFFNDLEGFDDFSHASDPARYRRLPSSWSIAVTDVVDSTAAIEAGRYRAVNSVGACSIVAALDAVDHPTLPYVFGGDGAAVVHPPDCRDDVREALADVRTMADSAFDLSLRAGHVPVEAVEDRGCAVRIAQYELSSNLSLAMFSGRGLQRAEELLKHGADALDEIGPADRHSDVFDDRFDAFSCRWEPLESRRGQIVALLVESRASDWRERLETYGRVLEFLSKKVGDTDELAPVSGEQLELTTDTDRLALEARINAGPGGLSESLEQLKLAAISRVGRTMRSLEAGLFDPDGTNYESQVIEHSDFQKMDGSLQMLIDTSGQEREELESFLRDQRARDRLDYGLHASDAAVMTCLVYDRDGDHVHFLDGADGGYAEAARQLKRQLSA